MRFIRMKGKTWTYKLYVNPANIWEKIAIYFRGYRKCKGGLLEYYGWFSHKKFKNLC